MKWIYFILFVVILTKGCTCTQEVNEFTEEERLLYSFYQENQLDTVFFENEANELDTILFDSLNFMENNVSSFMSNPSRGTSIEIFYLPFSSPYNFSPYKKSIPENPCSILDISKDNSSRPPFIYISYRDFFGEIQDITNITRDSLLSEFGINEYWLIEDRDTLKEKGDYSVQKVIWTRELGLTSYYLANGDYYKIKL